MRIQLWSYNYDPEPTGIAPVSRTWAKAMTARGHEIHVVAAHPHYPEPTWGPCRRPYVEDRDGIKVTRLPLWIGRDGTKARMRQEASFAAWQTALVPLLGDAEAVVAVSPCFPALAPAILNRRIRRKPLVLWIQDILPDGALSTNLVGEGPVLRASRRLETAAYRAADSVVVISERFRQNLLAKGVPDSKIACVYNPATHPIAKDAPPPREQTTARVLVMGNIGHSQGLPEVVRAFELSPELHRMDARLVITGAGVAADEVRAAISTDRVILKGVLSESRLGEEMAAASVGMVTQRSGIAEFNLPSKLMNYLARGLPVAAFVSPDSETASIVDRAGAGIVVDNTNPGRLGAELATLLESPAALAAYARSGHAFATRELTATRLAERFDDLLGARA